jgi:hypothetical protein
MAVVKSYDEMADRNVYRGDLTQVLNDLKGFGSVSMQPGFVDVKEGGDTFWLIVARIGNDWEWIYNTNFIFLIDGERFMGEGSIAKNEIPQDASNYVYEEINCGGDLGFLKLLANCKSAKFRLGEKDFTLPPSILADIKEIYEDIKSNGGYGLD